MESGTRGREQEGAGAALPLWVVAAAVLGSRRSPL